MRNRSLVRNKLTDEFKIDVMIVGAQKCGTTSIKEYLREHPQVHSHLQTEMTYFSIDEEFEKGLHYMIDYYFQNQSSKCNVAKHATMTRNRDAIKRLHHHNPNCKIVFCLRDPVKRAYSSYSMAYRNGAVSHSFEAIINLCFSKFEKNTKWHKKVFFELGNYIDHLDMLLEWFARDQIYIIEIDEFKKNPVPGVEELFGSLGLDEFIPNLNKDYNVGGTARFKSLNRLVKNKSWLKAFTKHILSPGKRATISRFISDINTKRNPGDWDMSGSSLQVLMNYYEKKNEDLSKRWGVNTSNWKHGN